LLRKSELLALDVPVFAIIFIKRQQLLF